MRCGEKMMNKLGLKGGEKMKNKLATWASFSFVLMEENNK